MSKERDVYGFLIKSALNVKSPSALNVKSPLNGVTEENKKNKESNNNLTGIEIFGISISVFVIFIKILTMIFAGYLAWNSFKNEIHVNRLFKTVLCSLFSFFYLFYLFFNLIIYKNINKIFIKMNNMLD